MAHLRAKGLYDQSMIILLSDHGEGLGDHGEDEHGVFLYREALQVPLIVKLPGSARKGGRVAAPVSLIDIAPTIASATGVAFKSTGGGINVLDAAALAATRAIYAETLYPRIHLGWSELRSLIDGPHHFIEAPRPELYDLSADPAERKNILTDQRRAFARLREQLATYGKTIEAPSAIDSEEAKKLEALGYLGSVKSTEGPLPDPKDRIADFGALQEAHRLSAAGRQEEAVTVLKKMLASNPRFSDAWAKLGSIYEELGQDDDAIRAYGEGIKASPASAAEFALSMTGLFLKSNRLDEARKHAELARERNPSAAHQFLARIALQSGDLATAEREVQAASADESARPRAAVTLAQIRAAQGRMGEAVQLLEGTRAEAASREIRVEQLELALGDVYAKMNRLPEAEQAFRREIAAFPSDLTAYANLGVVLVMQNKVDQIDPMFEEMARKNPSRRAYLVAAKTYEVLGDARTAAAWRQRAR
jgi:tetratricopeptide (TPR) repeat protein